MRSNEMLRWLTLSPGETYANPPPAVNLRSGLAHFVSESVASMARICCLAGIDPEKVALFTALVEAAELSLQTVAERINVVAIGKLAPTLLICDIDALEVDQLETLRQLRFVLPACVIVVYTTNMERAWSIACHLAGANGLLSKDSSEAELGAGVFGALRNGCFTDPRFAAA